MPTAAARGQPERGAAVVDFVLIMVLLVPLVLGVAQVALVLHVRNTVAAAASEGARSAAPLGASPADGAARTRRMISDVLADRYAEDVSATRTSLGDVPGVEVVVRTRVPALGLLGPSVPLTVRGHAVSEVEP
jgi:Flp pilus assembly protein TadG